VGELEELKQERCKQEAVKAFINNFSEETRIRNCQLCWSSCFHTSGERAASLRVPGDGGRDRGFLRADFFGGLDDEMEKLDGKSR